MITGRIQHPRLILVARKLEKHGAAIPGTQGIPRATDLVEGRDRWILRVGVDALVEGVGLVGVVAGVKPSHCGAFPGCHGAEKGVIIGVGTLAREGLVHVTVE